MTGRIGTHLLTYSLTHLLTYSLTNLLDHSGSGLVISRLSDDTWSAPSALLISGIGWGLQVGGELTDVIIILMTDGAVDAFSSKAQVCLG